MEARKLIFRCNFSSHRVYLKSILFRGLSTKYKHNMLTRFYSKHGVPNNFKRNVKRESNQDILENEVLYGRSVCNIALQASRRPIFKLHLLKSFQTTALTDARVIEIIKMVDQRGLPTSYNERKVLDSLSFHRPHQGVCLEVGELPFINLNEENIQSDIKATESENRSTAPVWVLLYGILDPMNVGAILRSCLYLNVDKVIVTGTCSPMTPVLSKASSGAAEILEVFSVENPSTFAQILVQNNWDIIATVTDRIRDDHKTAGIDIEDIYKAKVLRPTLVVIGSEGFGIPPDLMELCTRLVTIRSPQNDITANDHSKHLISLVGSLNVSNATAIILHQLLHRTAF